ncbi:DDB1- and CUL4-associated factor 12-like isoform X1 [Rhopilema esculentum]|uniref:DDB1- and CUL4-associated factor 12-like isoform X1 n=2 Tax=Rhopilema esculentum TaxID=499914 RepID=UPI0031D45081
MMQLLTMQYLLSEFKQRSFQIPGMGSRRKDFPIDGVYKYLVSRETNAMSKIDEFTKDRFCARKLPTVLKEKELDVGQLDKIFSSAWLDNKNVVCGTKCNSLIVVNAVSKRLWNIPVLRGSVNAPQPRTNCGIHSIAKNQNGSILATGGENPNNIAAYRLPSMEPICVGEHHSDWLFSLAWISPTLLASGSRDGSIAIWSIRDDCEKRCSPPVRYSNISPMLVMKDIELVDRVRDIVYNEHSQELAAISTNGFIHFLNLEYYKQRAAVPLPHCQENVCLAQEKINCLYAVGSLSHVSLIDPRTCSHAGSVSSEVHGSGVRSISFRDYVLTIGTGLGSVLFYDLRNCKYLQRQDQSRCILKAGKGWLRDDSILRHFFWDIQEYPNAVYTHCYDPTETKLFTAGGPLALGLYGNYAALWD